MHEQRTENALRARVIDRGFHGRALRLDEVAAAVAVPRAEDMDLRASMMIARRGFGDVAFERGFILGARPVIEEAVDEALGDQELAFDQRGIDSGLRVFKLESHRLKTLDRVDDAAFMGADDGERKLCARAARIGGDADRIEHQPRRRDTLPRNDGGRADLLDERERALAFARLDRVAKRFLKQTAIREPVGSAGVERSAFLRVHKREPIIKEPAQHLGEMEFLRVEIAEQQAFVVIELFHQ